MGDVVHIPVLLEQVLAALSPGAGQVYVDATAGLGGHALAVGRVVGPTGLVVLNDVDPGNLAEAEARVRAGLGDACPRLVVMAGNFADLPRRLGEASIRADMVLADLGFSSNQMAEAGRGLSFMQDGPLDMRLDPSLPSTAADLVATLPEGELARILWEYGQERQSRRIARKLVEERAREPISTTFRFAQIVREVVARPGGGGESIDPATRAFQALRIAVNDEMGVLESLLASVTRGAERAASGGVGWLNSGARVAIISFHSLEDRLVKRAMGELRSRGLAEEVGPRLQRAEEGELEVNRRARSARLRCVRLCGAGEAGVDNRDAGRRGPRSEDGGRGW